MKFVFLAPRPATRERTATAEGFPTRRRTEFGARSPIGPQLIIFLALGRIAQHFIGLVDFFKFFLGLFFVFGDVGMIFAGELAEGLFDVRTTGGARNTQGLVIIFVTDGHLLVSAIRRTTAGI